MPRPRSRLPLTTMRWRRRGSIPRRKSGRLKAVQKGLGSVDKADNPAAGKRFNEVKQAIEAALRIGRRTAGQSGRARRPSTRQSDPTVPGVRLRLGRLHPVTQTIDELKEIMGRLGFSVVDGPGGRRPLAQFRGPEHPAGPSRPRSAGELLPGVSGEGPGSRGQGSGRE